MKDFFNKTFKGLNPSYYFRHLFFGIAISVLIFATSNNESFMKAFGLIIYLIFNSAIYPYSRFVYESIVDFVMGDNVFFFNGIVFLVAKFITMMFCYLFAIFIAPIGLIFLYFYHSRKQD